MLLEIEHVVPLREKLGVRVRVRVRVCVCVSLSTFVTYAGHSTPPNHMVRDRWKALHLKW